MGLLLRMGWRNILRNRRRTLLTASIIALGLACLILMDAFIQGMVKNLVATATDTFLGQAQVHAAGFRTELKVEQTIHDLPGVVETLRTDPDVAAFVERIQVMGMVSSAADAESVGVFGVDPEKEKKLSKIAQAVVKGEGLGGSGDNGILLGERLAMTLQVGVGDRVVVTCARAGTGELEQEMFRVKGLFAFNSAAMDRDLAFIGLEKARSMAGLPGAAHEIAFRFKEGDGSEAFHDGLYRKLSENGNEALDWSRLMPDMKSAMDLTGVSSAILAVLLAVLAGLAILNTLFMALYERFFEFGVLRALGTRPFQLGALVMAESAALGLLSVALGTLLGFLFTGILSATGVNYAGIEFSGVTFQQAVYPQMRALQYTVFPLGVWVFTVLIALYPAVHAARIVPAKALHRSLG
ncbi:MAG TPA: ABC transporter permease [bacterium]|nr:ABC transporter permease [bacterium]